MDAKSQYSKSLLNRAEKAEAERDEARESASRANEFAATCQRERDEWESNADELQAKLDAAEKLPTLDREAVRKALDDSWVDATKKVWVSVELLHANLSKYALTPAAEGWPDWLGPKIDPGDNEVQRRHNGDLYVDHHWVGYANATVYGLRKLITEEVEKCSRLEAVARFIESEQAATGDEDQRVKEVDRELAHKIHLAAPNPDDPIDETTLRAFSRDAVQIARDAGWTPPESEDE